MNDPNESSAGSFRITKAYEIVFNLHTERYGIFDQAHGNVVAWFANMKTLIEEHVKTVQDYERTK